MARWWWLWGLVGCADRAMELPAKCADAPVLTWANFGQGFVVENCQACHASTSPNRQGAPGDVFFDTEADVWRWSDLILARATGESPDMPPQDGVTSDDRTRLELWLACGG